MIGPRIFILLFAAAALVGCGGDETTDINRKPAKHLVPADYEGAVITVFGQPGFPELPIQDGSRVHEYPSDGILITSSTRSSDGRATDETLHVLGDGSLRPSSDTIYFKMSEKGAAGAPPTVDYVIAVVGGGEYLEGREDESPDSFFSGTIAEAKEKMARLRNAPGEQEQAADASTVP